MQSSNLDKMRAGVDARFPIILRGFSCLFRPLSMYETNIVAAEVLAEIQTKPKQQQNSMMENSLISIKTLERASTPDVEGGAPQVSGMELQKLSPQEIEFLFNEYVAGCEKLNPRLEEMNKKDIDALIDECKKKDEGLSSALMRLSFWQVWNIAHSLLTQDG